MAARKPVEPRPCPFCGKKPEDGWLPYQGAFYFCCSAPSGSHTVYTYSKTYRVALNRWNRRADAIEGGAK